MAEGLASSKNPIYNGSYQFQDSCVYASVVTLQLFYQYEHLGKSV